MKAAAIFGLRARWKDAEPFAREGAIITQAGSPPAKADAVLIFGGDGTVNRHLPKLVELGIPALIVPAGSGNDFARAIGMATVEHALAAWKKFVRGEANVRAVDIGVITESTTETQSHREDVKRKSRPASGRARATGASALPAATQSVKPATENRLFCCIGGTGFDSETNRRANALPWWMRAHGGYVIAAARTLLTWEPVKMRVELPDIGVTLDEPGSFVVFANAPSYGDGMRLRPMPRSTMGCSTSASCAGHHARASCATLRRSIPVRICRCQKSNTSRSHVCASRPNDRWTCMQTANICVVLRLKWACERKR